MSDTHSISTPFASVMLKLLALFALATGAGGGAAVVRAQSGEAVAVVNGRRITQQEVDDSVISQLFPLQQQIYALRKSALENLITRAILEDEAQKRGITVEELRKQLTAGKTEVTPSQVEELYLENASTFAAMSPDEAKERLRLDLESQERMRKYREALSKLKEQSVVELRLEEPKLTSFNTPAAPSIGAKNAPVTVIEFADFQCGYCKESQKTTKQLLQRYGNEIRLVFKHLPLDIHPLAFSSAQAAFCAGEQNKFWQYHDVLFASEKLSPEAFDRIADEIGLDVPKFKTCFSAETSRAAVLRDMREAKRLGINGTPAFIINGKLFRGSLSLEDFKGVIERELKTARSASHKR